MRRDDDIEVKPPMYGAWHAQQHQVFRAGVGPASAPKLGKHWLADLNLNPRYRGAAGYGAEVVRKYQEDYVDACWDQIGDVLDAEMKFNLTRLAIEALGALKRKHFDVLPPERMLQVFGPALPRIEALGNAAQTYRINGQVASVGGRLATVEHAGGDGRYRDAARREPREPIAAHGRTVERVGRDAAHRSQLLCDNDGQGDQESGRLFRQRVHAGRHHRHEAVQRARSQWPGHVAARSLDHRPERRTGAPSAM